MTPPELSSSQDYLVQLQNQLKGFSPQEQAAILEEIASHIESGQGDPDLGDSTMERQRKLLKELGTPQLMGKKMKQVHRPNRVVDLLLVLVPALVFIPLVSMIVGQPIDYSPLDPNLLLSLRGVIAISGAMLLIGWLRRSDILLIYWSSDALLRVLSLMLREQRFSIGQEAIFDTAVECFFWWLALIGLVVLFCGLLWRNRANSSLVIFGLLPILAAAASLGEYYWLRTYTGLSASPLSWPEWLYQVSRFLEVAWLVLFFLSPRREGRWLALELEAINVFMMKTVAYWPDQPSIVLYTLILPVLVAMVWWLDRKNQPQVVLRT
jgi:hypothetical protein